jgi:hypothetical protein
MRAMARLSADPPYAPGALGIRLLDADGDAGMDAL